MFIFAGTGDSGAESSKYREEETEYEDDVIRIYVAGCQNGNVGGKNALAGMISPDLNVGADNIAAAFTEDGCLNINILREKLGDGISQIAGLSDVNPQAPKALHYILSIMI